MWEAFCERAALEAERISRVIGNPIRGMINDLHEGGLDPERWGLSPNEHMYQVKFQAPDWETINWFN